MNFDEKTIEDRLIPLCDCGCGEPVRRSKVKPYNWNRFIYKHGIRVKNPMKDPVAKRKHLEAMRNPEERKKRSTIMLAKGENHSAKRPEVREKNSKSKIGKARPDIQGENHWMKRPEIRAKITGKNNGFYGKIHTKEVKEYLSKIHIGRKNLKQTEYMLNGGSIHALSFRQSPSIPQKQLFKVVKEFFSTAKIEYPSLKYRIDIAIPDQKIAIEYDGSYWHQDDRADSLRQQELENMGWKFIRYKDYIPTIEEIKEDIHKVWENRKELR